MNLKSSNIWFKLFTGNSHFEEDHTQNYLVFQRANKYLKKISKTAYVLEWKSIGFSDESNKSPFAPKSFLDPSLDYLGNRIIVKFSASCLK